MSWLFSLWAKAKGWLALAGAVIAAVGIAFLRGRAEGKRILEAEQQRRRDKLQEHYDEIDREVIDPPRSYDRLRSLSDERDSR